jgi:Leucine-rich repeat (LRR) protein
MKHTIRYNTPSIIYQYDCFQIEIPNWCDVEFNSYFPNLEYLALDNNCISELNQILCLPKLKILSLEFSPRSSISKAGEVENSLLIADAFIFPK